MRPVQRIYAEHLVNRLFERGDCLLVDTLVEIPQAGIGDSGVEPAEPLDRGRALGSVMQRDVSAYDRNTSASSAATSAGLRITPTTAAPSAT